MLAFMGRIIIGLTIILVVIFDGSTLNFPCFSLVGGKCVFAPFDYWRVCRVSFKRLRMVCPTLDSVGELEHQTL